MSNEELIIDKPEIELNHTSKITNHKWFYVSENEKY